MPQALPSQTLDIIHYFKNVAPRAAKKTKQNIHSPGCRQNILLVIEQEGPESKGKSRPIRQMIHQQRKSS